jgi:hypothetical protein
MTGAESYEADLRIRYAAGIDDGEVPHYLPGGDPDAFPRAIWRGGCERAERLIPASAREVRA